MKVRKKPIIVEAVQFTPSVMPAGVWEKSDGDKSRFVIPTLAGDMTVNYGDWIITGIQGEKYPITHKIFCDTYDIIK